MKAEERADFRSYSWSQMPKDIILINRKHQVHPWMSESIVFKKPNSSPDCRNGPNINLFVYIRMYFESDLVEVCYICED